MNREITETKLKVLAREIWKVYKEYNPDGNFLNIIFAHGLCMVNNSYYERDVHFPIDFREPIPKVEPTPEELVPKEEA